MIRAIAIILPLLIAGCAGGSRPTDAKFAVPRYIHATAWPGHVELEWDNARGFEYHVYRSSDDGGTYEKVGEENGSRYLDFTGRQDRRTEYKYRIIPEGMDVRSEAAASFEAATVQESADDDRLLEMTQLCTTRYFHEFAHPATGMARERSNDSNGDIVTTGGTGFGIMALIAGSSRGYLSREEALGIVEKIVSFLEGAERFHGAWAHWYDTDTGQPFSFSRYDDGGDLVETAFLVQGLLTARRYFDRDDESESSLRSRITALWESVEWSWYTQGSDDSLYWHWSKRHGWKMNHRIKGYDETLITYVLAASSPTYPIGREIYERSYKTSDYYFNGREYYGITLPLGMEYGGPLFFTHYSFLGLDPRGLTDGSVDYFEQNRSHALIQRAYAIDNPRGHIGWGASLWGFTSSDDALTGYSSHHPGTDAENGTVSPTAAISSIVYTPEESMAVLGHMYYDLGEQLFGPYGFYDSYNPNMVRGQQVVRSYLAIDQGPIAVMIENYRSGLIWDLFMSNEEIGLGLKKLGFGYTTET